MFIRRKIKTLKAQSYEQHQLLKSVRTDRGPRQEVVLNMGTLDLPQAQWKALANAIEEKLNNQAPFSFEESCPEVEKLAAHYAQMILSKSLNQAAEEATHDDVNEASPAQQAAANYQNVDINSVRTSESKSIGAEYVMAEQMNQYGFDKILGELDFSPKQIDYAKHLIIGRAVHPSSERELSRWINDDSAIKELIGSTEAVYDNALHRTAVMLQEHGDTIQKSLRLKAKELFSLDETIVLYDLTNTYFEGKKAGNAKAQFGRSKERRTDCKLMTLALIVDSQGFPKESHILEGNAIEPETLAGMLESIRALGHSTERKTLVIDAGIASEENIALLRQENISYVAVSRKQSYDPTLWDQSVEKKVKLADQTTELTLKRAIVENEADGDQAAYQEAFLLCHSPHKEAKERQIIESRLNKFETAMGELSAGLTKARTTKKFGKIMERIGRLKEKYSVGNYFDIEVSQREEIVHAITCVRNLKGAAKTENLGKYVIRTDRIDLSEEDLSGVHRSLTTIESSFRAMKSDLGLRPNYHKCEKATTAHIFLSVLAYHVVCPILRRLSDSGLNYTWNSVRNLLSSHDRVVTAFNTDDGHCVYVKNTTSANLSQKSIYNGLGIKHDPLKNVYFKRKVESTARM
jgi:transposase